MKVLIVSNSTFPFYFDGQANVVNLLAKGLIGRRVEVHIATIMPEKDAIEDYEGIKMHYLNVDNSIRLDPGLMLYTKEGYYNKKIESQFKKLLKEISPDLVNFHSLEGIGANTVEIAQKAGFKTVVNLHDYSWICPNPFMLKDNGEAYTKSEVDYEEWGRAIGGWEEYIKSKNNQNIPEFINEKFSYLKSILTKADLVIAPSKYLAKDYMANGLSKEKFKVIPNPVDKPPFKYKPSPKDKLVFGHMAGYGGRGKGVDLAAKAFEELHSANARLEIWSAPGVAKRVDFNYLIYLLRFWKSPFYILKEYYIWLKQVKRLILRNNSPGKVTYWPKYSPEEKYRIFQRFDCILVPSMYRESFSLVTAEAMAFGIPVIASNRGGMVDMIKPNENGILFEQGDVDSLKEAIKTLCTKKDLYQNMYNNLNEFKYLSSAEYVKNFFEAIQKV